MSTGHVPEDRVKLEVPLEHQAQRLDSFIASRRDLGLSRHQVQRLIAAGKVWVEGYPAAKAGQKLSGGQTVEVRFPPVQREETTAQPGDVPVIYEDDEILVVDKPAGLVVHPAPGHPRDTLVNYLLYRNPELETVGETGRCGIVHRLDRDTSGLLVVAKTRETLEALQLALKAREIKRVYRALVVGTRLPTSGEIAAPVGRHPRKRKKMAVVEGGRPALSRFWVERYLHGYTLLRLELKTGRTHQLRVHLAYWGHPVAGDPVYGGKGHLGLTRQALHAAQLSFFHPSTGQSLNFGSPLPADVRSACQKLGVDGEDLV